MSTKYRFFSSIPKQQGSGPSESTEDYVVRGALGDVGDLRHGQRHLSRRHAHTRARTASGKSSAAAHSAARAGECYTGCVTWLAHKMRSVASLIWWTVCLRVVGEKMLFVTQAAPPSTSEQRRICRDGVLQPLIRVVSAPQVIEIAWCYLPSCNRFDSMQATLILVRSALVRC